MVPLDTDFITLISPYPVHGIPFQHSYFLFSHRIYFFRIASREQSPSDTDWLMRDIASGKRARGLNVAQRCIGRVGIRSRCSDSVFHQLEDLPRSVLARYSRSAARRVSHAFIL